MDISVVVVSWNTRELLRDCLGSIYEEAGRVSFEVLVVDNASADGSAEMVASQFPQVGLIRNAQNRGFAAANNQAIALAQGRYVLLLNPDTVVLDGAIGKLVAFADAHPDAGVVGGRAVFPDGRTQYNCFLFPSLLNLALSLSRLRFTYRRNRFFGRYHLTWWDYASPRVVNGVAGCFLLARREAIDEAGPMSEDYFMYVEDAEWCWRFRQHGWKTMYTPDAVIIHVRDASGSQAAKEMNVHQHRSMITFLETKSGRVAGWVANAMFCTASLIKVGLLGVRRLTRRGGTEKEQQEWQMAMAALKFHLLGRLPKTS